VREFIDERHIIIGEYYKIMDRYTGKNAPYIIPKLEKLIDIDPFFFDAYTSLVELFYSLTQFEKGDILINQASEKALKRIVDKKGNWPDKLEWGWFENRHIIRAILNQAILYWKCEKTDEALNLFRKLLRSNPNDNVGTRNYILAIRKNISFNDFELRFNKGGFYDMDLPNWFDANYKSYLDEFEWWDEETDKLESQDKVLDLDGIENDNKMQFITIENNHEMINSSKDLMKYFDMQYMNKPRNERKLFSQSKESTEPKIFQLKITINEVKPPIWRRILISEQANFYELHLAIQDFFNWSNYHLHEFHFPHPNNSRYKVSLLGLDPDGEIPDDLDNGFLDQHDIREDEVRLCDVFSKNYLSVVYLYDFGDNWEHSIKLEKVYPFKKEFNGPLCVGGKRATPPEDCGGPWGYQDLLEIISNKHHPEYQEMKEWVGATFNSERMDVQMNKFTPRQIEERYGPNISI